MGQETDEQKKHLLKKLKQAFPVHYIECFNESHLHKNHPQNNGKGHFRCVLVSDVFEKKSPLDRHRLVYKELQKDFDALHAFSLKTYSIKEWEKKKP